MTIKEFMAYLNQNQSPVCDEFEIMVALTDSRNNGWSTKCIGVSRVQWGCDMNFGSLMLYPTYDIAVTKQANQRDVPEPIIEETLYEGRRTRISRQCAICKERVTLQMKFCPHCGQALDTYKKNLVYKGCWNNSKPTNREGNVK